MFAGCFVLVGLAEFVVRRLIRFSEFERLVTEPARREVRAAVRGALRRQISRYQLIGCFFGILVFAILFWLKYPITRAAYIFFPIIMITTLWIPLVVTMLWPQRLRRIAWKELALRGVPLCTACGYDLTGLPAITSCPECGELNGVRLETHRSE